MAIEAPALLRAVHRPLSIDAHHRHSRPQQSRMRCTLSIPSPDKSGLGETTKPRKTKPNMIKEEIPQMQNKRRKGVVIVPAQTVENALEIEVPHAKSEPSVALMLQKVIDGGITADNVSALESLVGLYDRMQAKNAEREFNQAFAKLQSELSSVNATREVANKQGVVMYRFAPYEDIMESAKPNLVANGFAISFTTRFQEGGRIVAICTLRHVGGHSVSNEFAVRIGAGPPNTTESQQDGAAKTYAKRGALCDALNIVVEHDDDARMIGQPIGKALAQDLLNRVKLTGSDMISFLKFAGVKMDVVEKSIGEHDPLEFFMQISDERWTALDELLKRKEAAKVAREKLSTEEWK